jgi:hypothetical protein
MDGARCRVTEIQIWITQLGAPKSKHNKNNLHPSLQLNQTLRGYRCPTVKLGPIARSIKPVILVLSSVVAQRRGLNHHFDKHVSSRNYDVIIIYLQLTSLNSSRVSGATVGVHNPGYPMHGFKHFGPDPIRLPSHAYLAHHLNLAPRHKANQLPPDSTRGPGAPAHPRKVCRVNTIVFYKLLWAILSRTNNTFNQEETEPPY